MTRMLILLLSLVCCGVAVASQPPPDLHDSQAVYEFYKGSQKADYGAVGARYRTAVAAAPTDYALAVEQCRFVQFFQYAEDIDWNESASDDLERCRDELTRRAGNAPEVRVYLLETGSAQDEDLAEATLADSRTWPAPLRARVAARLATIYENSDEAKAGHYAVVATQLGRAELAAKGIDYLARSDRTAALALAAASPPATSTWEAVARLVALGKLGDATALRRELARSQHAGLDLPQSALVDAYLAIHDLSSANRAAARLGSDARSASARFDLALANGDFAKARALVKLDDEFETWVGRFSRIAGRAPMQALTPSLLPVMVVLLLCVLATGLLPVALLVPVHYRGLVRRVRNRAPLPLFDRVGLRHAWLATAVILIVPTLVMIAMRPDSIAELFSDDVSSAATQFSVAAAGSVLSLLALGPWLGRLRVSPASGRGVFGVRVALVVAGCWAAIFLIGVASNLVHDALVGGDSATLQTRTIHALVSNSRHEVGLLATWVLMAVLTPVLEEAIFRGMLLGGMSRHISFGWSNAIQASLFACVHGDEPRFLVYLAMGLAAGWLTRRYRSLLPAIALHALNNTVAVLLQG